MSSINFNDLNHDCIKQIFSYLPINRSNIPLVCQLWKKQSETDHLWQPICKSYFKVFPVSNFKENLKQLFKQRIDLMLNNSEMTIDDKQKVFLDEFIEEIKECSFSYFVKFDSIKKYLDTPTFRFNKYRSSFVQTIVDSVSSAENCLKLKILLDLGANPNLHGQMRPSIFSPLATCLRKALKNEFILLLEFGAKINQTDKEITIGEMASPFPSNDTEEIRSLFLNALNNG